MKTCKSSDVDPNSRKKNAAPRNQCPAGCQPVGDEAPRPQRDRAGEARHGRGVADVLGAVPRRGPGWGRLGDWGSGRRGHACQLVARQCFSCRAVCRSHPVSRILCLCGHLSGTPVARRLKRRGGGRRPAHFRRWRGPHPPPWPCSRWGLPGGGVSAAPVRSCRTISPLPRLAALGGMFLWHFPSGRPARPLAGIAALRSPDFPLARRASGHPDDFGL